MCRIKPIEPDLFNSIPPDVRFVSYKCETEYNWYFCALRNFLQGCYSPASSMISTATIRSNNIKESKEKKNREKLLAGPGSEFSLSNPEDMELDYYDYNVTNAGAAPGSYLGMDPAYLVWIPPLDGGVDMAEASDDYSESDEEDDDDCFEEEDEDDDDEILGGHDEPHYEEILPTFAHLSPGSNTETPSDEAPTLPPLNGTNTRKIDECDEKSRNRHNLELTKVSAASTFQACDNTSNVSATTKATLNDAIQMRDLYTGKSVGSQRYAVSPLKGPSHSRPAIYRDNKDVEAEKETAVIKSSMDNARDYYELDDIQFADEEDEDDDEITNALAAHKDNNRMKMMAQPGKQHAMRSVTLASSTSRK